MSPFPDFLRVSSRWHSRTQRRSAPCESAASIQAGVTWGQTVADAIIAWRNTDGFTPAPPPFTGGLAPGQWRPTPPANASGAGPQYAYMTPWAILSPSQFRPDGPPALNSARYAIDFNETRTMGSATSTLRTPDQTIASWFWASSTAGYIWNTVALDLIAHDNRDWDRTSAAAGTANRTTRCFRTPGCWR